MKITVDRKLLAAALKTATVVSATASLPILRSLHLQATKGDDSGRLAITGTNLDLTITSAVDATVERPGEALILGPTLRALVEKAAADTVTITLDAPGNEAKIDAGGTATLITSDLANWPQLAVADGQRFDLSGPDIDHIARVVHAASKDTNRPAITGVHFTGKQVQATDSYRVAVADLLTVQELPGKVVPAEVVARVVNDSPFGMTVAFDARSVTFATEDGATTWTSRLIDADYPPVDRVMLDETPFDLVVAREPLIEAVRWVSLVAGDAGRVKLERTGDLLLVRSGTVDVGDAAREVPCSGSWESSSITVNFKYLLDLLGVYDDDEIRLGVVDDRKPLQVFDADRMLHTVLMPIWDKA
jgi:DNA polymerase-3 subunit beta